MNIRSRVNYIQKKRSELYAELLQLQESCTHPDETLTKIAHENSGYDYQDYWYDFHCEICDKRWREEQNHASRNRGRK